MDVATAPAKKYIAMQILEGKSPYTVAIKLLKGTYTYTHTHMHARAHTYTHILHTIKHKYVHPHDLNRKC